MVQERNVHERAGCLERLRSVVLLENFLYDQQHLQQKIQERARKEFPSSTPAESDQLEHLLQKCLKFAPREVKRFKNSESFVKVLTNVREKDVHLFYKFKLPEDPLAAENSESSLVDSYLLQLCVTLDGLMRSGVNSITVYVPFLPYLRQDKKDDGRVPISAKLVFNLLESAAAGKLKRICTFDMHAQQEQGFWDGPVDDLPAGPEFAAYYRGLFSSEEGFDVHKMGESVEVMAADAGGVKRTDKMAQMLKCRWDVFTKLRTAHSEADTRLDLTQSLQGKKVIIAEDMIDTCGSIAGEKEKGKEGPIPYLIRKGAQVYVCATHAVFSAKNGISAERRLRESGGKIVVTDSLQRRRSDYYQEHKDWLTVISLDYVLAKAFFCNQAGDSISDFLRNREEGIKAEKVDFKVTASGSKYTVEG